MHALVPYKSQPCNKDAHIGSGINLHAHQKHGTDVRDACLLVESRNVNRIWKMQKTLSFVQILVKKRKSILLSPKSCKCAVVT